MPVHLFAAEKPNDKNMENTITRRPWFAGCIASVGRLAECHLAGYFQYPKTLTPARTGKRTNPRFRSLFTISGALLLTLLMVTGAQAQKSDAEQAKSMGGASKPVLPSVSNPSGANSSKITLYPASAQETADAILADSLGRLFDQTDEHFHHGEYNHVYSLNRVVVQGDPHNVEAYGNSAYLLWSSDRNEDAIAFLKLGIKANPNTYYMYDEMGQHYWMHLKDAASAIPYFEQAIKFKCHFTTLNSLAYCYQKTGAWDKAVDTWRLATQLPNNTQAERHLAQAIAERDKRAKLQ